MSDQVKHWSWYHYIQTYLVNKIHLGGHQILLHQAVDIKTIILCSHNNNSSCGCSYSRDLKFLWNYITVYNHSHLCVYLIKGGVYSGNYTKLYQNHFVDFIDLYPGHNIPQACIAHTSDVTTVHDDTAKIKTFFGVKPSYYLRLDSFLRDST